MNRLRATVIASSPSAMRMFSTAQHVPPKKLHGTTGRYAGAVYTAASKVGLLDKVEAELTAVGDIIKKSPNFAAFLENPTISRNEKAVKIGELVTEPTFSHITRNLFLVLAANGRIGESFKVISGFQELIAAARGSVKVTIISAEVLKKKQLETIQSGIVAIIGEGKSIDVETKVDASLLGGLQVLVGDRFLDLSVSSRVAELGKSLETVN